MKIFALNLCLEFVVEDPGRNYHVEPISFSELMGYLFKGADFSNQKFYVKVDHSLPEIQQHVFDLQTNEIWRDWDLSIAFVFVSQTVLNDFLESYRDLFKQVDAAGGLVQNEKGEYLCIYNRKRWTLPKGGVEWREEIEAAALREVMEETGLETVQIVSKLNQTYHTFRRRKQWVLKTTHWYRMKAHSDQELIPQTEESIEAVQWMDRDNWLEVAEDSYPLIRHLFQEEFSRSLT